MMSRAIAMQTFADAVDFLLSGFGKDDKEVTSVIES